MNIVSLITSRTCYLSRCVVQEEQGQRRPTMRPDLICILWYAAFSLANERREAARSGAERRERSGVERSAASGAEWSGAKRSGTERSEWCGAERSDASGASERVIFFFPSASLSLFQRKRDRPTDRQTDTASYRDAWAHLKIAS